MTDYTISAPVWEGDRAPLAKAFVAAQKVSEAIKKANTNPAFKSKYADLAAVVEAVVPALNAAGVGVLQFPAYDGDMVAVTTMLLHESGASVSATLNMRPSKSDPQGVGSATTYARRYSLLAMTGAAPEDDDGQAASGPRQDREPLRAEPKPPTLAERADKFAGTLRACKSQTERDKAYKLASGLLADLDAKDPERLAEIEALVIQLADEQVAA
jgi:hypothetical protein